MDCARYCARERLARLGFPREASCLRCGKYVFATAPAHRLCDYCRGVNAETVLMTGVLTNQCIAATSKDAMFRDFKPIVVEECTGTTLPHLHEPALEMIRVGWGEVRSLDETLADLERLR